MSTEERAMGIEHTPPAWKAGALPLSYTRNLFARNLFARNLFHQQTETVKTDLQSLSQTSKLTKIMAGAGFEPAKAEPPDLQSGPFGHSGIPPKRHLTEERHPQLR